MSAATPRAAYRAHRRAMGTVTSIHVHDVRPRSEIDAAVEAVFAELERLEDLFSTFRPHSQISQCNRGERSLLDCAPEVLDVLDACTWLEHESDGAFRAHRSDRVGGLDPAGFVKGWATERAAGALREAGLGTWYVATGGDLLTCGAPDGSGTWTFGVAHPFDPSRVVAELEVPAGYAVATSGIGARGRHIRGASGEAVDSPFAAITVVGPTLTWSDALATAAFARGADAIAWLRRYPAHTAYAFDAGGVLLEATRAAQR